MKKILATITVCLSLFACNNSNKDYAIVSGKATNTNGALIRIIDGKGKEVIKTITPEQDGTFQDTLHNVGNGKYFSLSSGNSFIQLFLEKGSNVIVDFEETLQNAKISGSQADKVKYLIDTNKAINSMVKNALEFWSQTPETFKTTLKTTLENQKEKLKNLNIKGFFAENEIKSLDYYLVLLLKRYPRYHQYYTQSETSVDLPKDFFKEAELVNYDNDLDYVNIPVYSLLINMHYTELIGDPSNAENLKKFFKTLDNVKSENIKNDILKRLTNFISLNNPSNEVIYDYVIKNSNDELKEDASKKYQTLELIKPGKPSPTFSYENYNGGKTSLEDLKGKLIYIDVWATWCGPCIGEIPHLIELEKQFHGKNIEFVSISIDDKKDHEKWKSFVKEKGLKGVQLFADKAWKSDFVQNYLINGIPRFIIIDQQGNIINSDAPRPSDPNIKNLLESLLK